MDNKRFLLGWVLLIMASALFAQPVTVKRSEVKITESGKSYYLHTVETGQTLFSIARAYQVDQAEIVMYNPGADTRLQVGQRLKIPDKTLSTQESPQTPSLQTGTQPRKTLTHTVSSGETLFGIARKYEVSVSEIMEANPQITQFDNLSIGQELKIPETKTREEMVLIRVQIVDSAVYHQVQRGESVFGISRMYNVTQDSLIAWNPELVEAPLRRGQTLKIVYRKEVREATPIQVTPQQVERSDLVTHYDTVLHQIRDQETIWGLARRYNTTVDKIMEMNPELKDGLKSGHFIYIPVPKSVAAAAHTDTPSARGCEKSRYKNKYKVALMIPLYLDEIDRIFITPSNEEQITKPFFKSFSFVEFYEGVLIALDSMKRSGMSVDLHVYDITDDTLALKRLLAQPEMAYMDLIIGPFFTNSYEVAGRFAVQHRIKLVSPFARSQQMLSRHGNIFQMNASSESKLAELARHIALQYEDPRVIFVLNNNETDRALANAFKTSFEHHTASRSRRPYYTEVIYSSRGLAGVTTQLDATRHNVIVNLVTGETVVSNYVSNIARLTRNFNITMFGIPEWQEYRTFNLNDLMAVDLHLFSTAFVDYESPHTLYYLKEFRSRYRGEPEENFYGFMGYDIGLYFLRALHEFGLDFEECLEDLSYNHLSTGFIWRRVNGKGFENIHLNIFRYSDFRIEAVPQTR
jgi:LysM repeat protein/ABC-type branched-subunit amino acid transport system substrate-binding protein